MACALRPWAAISSKGVSKVRLTTDFISAMADREFSVNWAANHAGLDGMPADEVLATPTEFTGQLGLQDLVSPLRLRGMAAMLGRIKRQIREKGAG